MINELNKGAVIAEINGLKYFKLQSKYPGDYTKNCGLLGNEIDENFYFLRSKDIANVAVDENKNVVATRVDGEKLVVDTTELLKSYQFFFDKTKGVLTIKFPNGNVETLDGFLVQGDAKVATDSTITGNGTVKNPLGLSVMERTGTVAPVNKMITDGKLPTGVAKGYRVISKEKISNYGCLYTFDGVKAIMNALEENASQWRVPSREDWAELLNSAESCDKDKNHDTTWINVWTGKDAGARAKTINEWATSTRTEEGLPVKGEDNLPTTGIMGTFHVLPVGECEEDEEYIGEEKIQGFGRSSTFWSSSLVCSNRKDSKVFDESNENPVMLDGEKNIFTRTFAYNTRKVKQESSKPRSKYSLRLVKDYDTDANVEQYETILGHSVKCVLISDKNTNYNKVWTSVNIGFKEADFSGSSEYEEWGKAQSFTEGFFVAEWDGNEWHRKQLNEGDSVVIIEGPISEETHEVLYNHEWRIYSGATKGEYILKDCVEALQWEYQKEIDKLNKRVDTEIVDRTNADDALCVKIDTEVSDRKNEISALTIERVEVNDTDIREAYKLVDKRGIQHGELIKIYKDEKIHKIQIGHSGGTVNPKTGEITDGPKENPDVLQIVYRGSNGDYKLVEINLDELFKLNAGNGIEFKDGKIHVKLNSKSDKFLLLNESGLTLEGVEFNFVEVADAVGLTGDTTIGWDYVPGSGTYYISATTTVSDAIKELDSTCHKIDTGGSEAERMIKELSATTIIIESALSAETQDRISGDTNIAQILGVSGNSESGFTIEFTRPKYQKTLHDTSVTFDNFDHVPDYKEIIENGYWDFTKNKPQKNEYIEIEGKTPPEYYRLVAGTKNIISAKTYLDAIINLDAALNKSQSDLTAEITRAKNAEKGLQNNIDDEVKRAKDAESILEGQDIEDNTYNISVQDGLVLKRKDGSDIKITFDGNFGTI